jgi:2-amino-4-hydroxy-6-hydroxymethyldihydropteridine diphosphokinase
MTRAYLSLGSNLAKRADHLRATLGALSRAPRTELVGISRIYETRAVEVKVEQPDYLNCVAEVECDLAAVELLRLCQGIEVALGRDRKGEKAPRTVDIDVLLFGEEVVDGQDFRVPHRGISRAYNLVGLADLDPSVRVPGAGAVTDLLAGADLGGVREYGGGEKAVPATLRDRLRAGQVRRTGSPTAGYRKVGGGRG